jgi:hypothetical protein
VSGGNNIVINWNAVPGATGYRIYMANQPGVMKASYLSLAGGQLFDLAGNTATTHTRAGAATGTYYLVVTAISADGESAESAEVSVTVSGTTFTANLETGFNLIGNSLDLTINVPATFGSPEAPVAGVTENVVTVWKWNAADGRWAFHSPQLTVAANAAYAAGKGYDVLTAIGAGEGYWVNSISQIALPAQTGAEFNWDPAAFGNLSPGFNLIAHTSERTPSEFNSDISATPPAPGTIPTDNFLSLWMWDAAAAKWYFYSPLLESTGGLQAVKDYADSHFYLHFQDYSRKIGLGAGFWVNRP